jgi:hypothetical protein
LTCYCRYKESLQAASSFITDAWPDHVEQALVLNLGPSWMNVDAYSLFRNNVIEIPFKYWESPPGMGLCPLDVAFTVCSSISSWLTLNDDHFVVGGRRPTSFAHVPTLVTFAMLASTAHAFQGMWSNLEAMVKHGGSEGAHLEIASLVRQVLHTRSCTGVGMHFLHFLTACYLVFSLECQSISSALNTLPPLKSSATVQLGGSAPCRKCIHASHPI